MRNYTTLHPLHSKAEGKRLLPGARNPGLSMDHHCWVATQSSPTTGKRGQACIHHKLPNSPPCVSAGWMPPKHFEQVTCFPPAQSKSFHTWNSSRILSSSTKEGHWWWGRCSRAPNHSAGLVLEEDHLAWCQSSCSGHWSPSSELSTYSWSPSWILRSPAPRTPHDSLPQRFDHPHQRPSEWDCSKASCA